MPALFIVSYVLVFLVGHKVGVIREVGHRSLQGQLTQPI